MTDIYIHRVTKQSYKLETALIYWEKNCKNQSFGAVFEAPQPEPIPKQLKLDLNEKENLTMEKEIIIKKSSYIEAVSTLEEMLLDFDLKPRPFQTDVCLYISEDYADPALSLITLDDFTNVGGNSWRNDDHFVLYSDMPHNEYDTIFNCYSTVEELITAAGADEEDIFAAVRIEEQLEDDDEVRYQDVYNYIMRDPELYGPLYDDYRQCCIDCFDYHAEAVRILDGWLEDNDATVCNR